MEKRATRQGWDGIYRDVPASGGAGRETAKTKLSTVVHTNAARGEDGRGAKNTRDVRVENISEHSLAKAAPMGYTDEEQTAYLFT